MKGLKHPTGAMTVPATEAVDGPLARLAAVVLRHRRLVALGWAVVFLAGAFAASGVSDRLSVNFSLPGQPGYETAHVFAPPGRGFGASPAVRRATTAVAAAMPGFSVTQTGLDELAAQGEQREGFGVLAETLIGGLGALCVLAFVFASLLAFVPLLVAAVSILTTLLIVFAISYVGEVSFIVQFLVALVGLGVAIDYSLLLVTRWREERHRGRDNHDAVIVAMSTAGHAILLSGLTVAISLLALVVLPVPGLRSVGWGGMLIPLTSVAVTLTLLPAFLGGIGRRLDWPRLRSETRPSRGWTWWGRQVVRRRATAAAVGLALLALFITPVFGLTAGSTSPEALSKSGRAHAAYTRLTDGGVPRGVLTPMQVLTRADARDAVAARLRSVPDVAFVAAPKTRDSNRAGTSVLIAVPEVATLNDDTLDVVRDVRSAFDGINGAIGAAGVGPSELDYVAAVFGNAPLMLAVIALLTLIVLTRAFRSPLLAVKAIVLNLVSLAATFGVVTWFWQEGHGSEAVFGIPATGAVPFWMPLMIFAFLFGLSMDYEVFILSRMREEYDRHGTTDAAVIEGLGRTGRLVTSAALILFLAFASMASAPSTDLKLLATALGVGILLDATIIRALLLPALVAMFGRWNWWLPRPLARALLLRPLPEPSRSMPPPQTRPTEWNWRQRRPVR
jgi:putative drug exporter of the RND superfamily